MMLSSSEPCRAGKLGMNPCRVRSGFCNKQVKKPLPLHVPQTLECRWWPYLRNIHLRSTLFQQSVKIPWFYLSSSLFFLSFLKKAEWDQFLVLAHCALVSPSFPLRSLGCRLTKHLPAAPAARRAVHLFQVFGGAQFSSFVFFLKKDWGVWLAFTLNRSLAGNLTLGSRSREIVCKIGGHFPLAFLESLYGGREVCFVL